MGMIRVYRHPSGTAPANPTFVRQYDDTDGGAFSDAAIVSGATLPAGTYDITVTNQDTGKAVSGYSNALSLTVNAAAGFSDNFNRANGAIDVGQAAWVAHNGYALPVVSSNQAMRNTTSSRAYWNDTIAANQYVQGRISQYAASDNAELLVRMDAPAVSADTFYSGRRAVDAWHLYRFVADTPTEIGYSLANLTREWMRVEANGTTIRLLSSTDGVSWTEEISVTDANIASGGVGFGVGGATCWVDDWSAGAL